MNACAWCKETMTEQMSVESNYLTTHSICKNCFRKAFGKTPPITKLISGAQTGADRAGLVVAKRRGIATGGSMPKGFLAHDGYHPEFADLYNIEEHPHPAYPGRTYKNVKDADGTVRFAVDFGTAGERCTLNAIVKYQKYHYDVDIMGTATPIDVAHWIRGHQIQVLNVAGNSAKTCSIIGDFVEAFLEEVFNLLSPLP